MRDNCRAQFTAQLRKLKIHYTTSKNLVSIKDYNFVFDPDLEYITIRCAAYSRHSYNFPYSTPNTIINKWKAFEKMLKSALQISISKNYGSLVAANKAA
jgi:hypothetical protein